MSYLELVLAVALLLGAVFFLYLAWRTWQTWASTTSDLIMATALPGGLRYVSPKMRRLFLVEAFLQWATAVFMIAWALNLLGLA